MSRRVSYGIVNAAEDRKEEPRSGGGDGDSRQPRKEEPRDVDGEKN